MMSPGIAFPDKRPAVPTNPVVEDDNSLTLSLPVRKYASEVAEFLNSKKTSPVVILISDTGSGKSTQIPQLLTDKIFDDYFNGSRRRIAVTQPRRVAAVSVATRVAAEYGCKLGDEVGYSVRFEDVTSEKTHIKYMTDGMLVREAQADWMLPAYNLIILDEVHERSLHTDILLGLVRKAQVRRRKYAQQIKTEEPLRIILMSATMDLDRLQTFWGTTSAPALYIPGKTFPVELRYSRTPLGDYIYSAIVALFQIHRNEPAGDILLFLTGQEEIDDVVRRCREIAKSLPVDQGKINFFPLYAALPTDQQMLIIGRQPANSTHRKAIVATNVAETSITIPGVKYVVDCGKAKNKLYNAATGMEILKVENISQSQAWQRTGRAGREQAGICYRLYTEHEFNSWPQHPIPEIQRSNLATVLLQIIAMGMEKPLIFPYFDRPDEESLQAALDQLEWLGALTQAVESGDVVTTLTKEGELMAKFPLDPRYSRCILRAKTHSCLEEMLSIIAMFSCDNVFAVPTARRQEAAAVHEKFSSNEGDPLVMLNIWRAYRATNPNGRRLWLSTNFINQRNMTRVERTRQQLREICDRSAIPMSSCGNNTTPVRRALCEGLFMNSAEMLPDGSYISVATKQSVFLHPSSFLFKKKPACIVYNELIRTAKMYVRNLCLVDRDWVDAVGAKYFVEVRRKLAENAAKTAEVASRKRKIEPAVAETDMMN